MSHTDQCACGEQGEWVGKNGEMICQDCEEILKIYGIEEGE